MQYKPDLWKPKQALGIDHIISSFYIITYTLGPINMYIAIRLTTVRVYEIEPLICLGFPGQQLHIHVGLGLVDLHLLVH